MLAQLFRAVSRDVADNQVVWSVILGAHDVCAIAWSRVPGMLSSCVMDFHIGTIRICTSLPVDTLVGLFQSTAR